MKLSSDFLMNEPAVPPRRLRRWFIEFDRAGQMLTLWLFILACIGYTQIIGLDEGVVLAVLKRFWALWALTMMLTYLLALDLTAEIYERTTGSAYRSREKDLRNIAACAESDAISVAEDAVRVRTQRLDEREADLTERLKRVRIESGELHEQQLLLATKMRELKAKDQASCSGTGRSKRKSPKNQTSNPTSFKDLGLP